ncbi:MAG: protein kinase [Polyangiaceae bacterium]
MADPLAQTVAFDGTAPAVDSSPSVSHPAETLAEGPVEGAASLIESGRRVVAGRYEVLGLLGAGGMGNVYRALDRELDEVVALKMLRPEIASNAAALARFRSEVKLARRVTHPSVARVFDIGDEGGERYLTMELIDGEPLGTTIARAGRLGAARAIEIACAVCAGLGAAHSAGVIHRDLKPDNILLARDGRVVVTDFGIARAAGADVKSTGAIVGTPAYMAPEQVEGKPVDARADLYALGAVLFEMLTGEAPWVGDNAFTVAAARLLHPPPNPRAKRPDLPPDLAAIVVRALGRKAEERFASAADVAAALSRVEVRRAVPSAAPPPPSRPASPPLIGTPVPACKKQVAVLPFRNAGAPEHDHLAEGLTEELIDLLSMAGDLRVRSRGTVMRYRGGERDPREIGRELGVPVVVDGSVRKAGGSVRVAVRLVSVADGVQIWHRRWDRPEADIFAVSDEAARAIAAALAVEIKAPARAAPSSAEAIDVYLRARALYFRFFQDTHGESLKLFEEALSLAPDDPRIIAGYAMAICRLPFRSDEVVQRASIAAERAVDRAPNLAEAHVAQAIVLHHQSRRPEAVTSLARALRLSRFSAEAHDTMGRLLAETTLQEPARKHLEAALTLEPEMELARLQLARLHYLEGRAEMAWTVIHSSPTGGDATLPLEARIALWSRDIEKARVLVQDPRMENAGRYSLARILLEFMVEGADPFTRAPSGTDRSSRFRAFLTQLGAECAAYARDDERTLVCLEDAVKEGVFDVAWADGCPLFEPLRQTPRFRAVREAFAATAKKIEDAYLAAS